jgi:hypothetical protein
MKLTTLFYSSLLLMSPLLVQAGSVTLVTGTPGDGVTSPATLPSPNLHGLLLNFSNLTTNANCQADIVADCPAFNPTTYAPQGVTISTEGSEGLVVYPYSVQSGPNELFDNTTDGSSNVIISLSFGANAIGVGIADSDDLCTVDPATDCGPPTVPVPITLQALGLGGVDLGSAFTVTTPETNPDTAGNGYWVVEDPTAEIYGLEISTPATDEGGLAIADVQVAPEPSSFLLLISGAAILAMIASYRLRKKA